MSERYVYLNGDYMPIAEASVSVLDRGFLFGDGVYEVIPVFGSKLLRIDEHLLRLEKSLSRISLANPFANTEWKERFKDDFYVEVHFNELAIQKKVNAFLIKEAKKQNIKVVVAQDAHYVRKGEDFLPASTAYFQGEDLVLAYC